MCCYISVALYSFLVYEKLYSMFWVCYTAAILWSAQPTSELALCTLNLYINGKLFHHNNYARGVLGAWVH